MCTRENQREKTVDEERLAILRMVAEGKITADEAVQLLDALKEAQRRAESPPRRETTGRDYSYNYRYEYKYRPREERHRHRDRAQFDWKSKFGGFGTMFKGMSRMFDDLFQGWEDQTLDIPEGSEVSISCTAGSLTIRGTDSGQVRVSADGGARGPRMLGPRIHVDHDAKRLDITATTHNLTVELPWQAVAVQAHVVGGSLHVADLSAALALEVAGGSLHAHDVTGAIIAKIVGGQADLAEIHSSDLDVNVKGGSVSAMMGTLTAGTIALRAVGGNVALRLPAASAFDVEASVTHGHIRTNLPIAVQTGHVMERLTGTYNGGGATIHLSTKAGDIEIETVQTPATEPVATEAGEGASAAVQDHTPDFTA